MKISFVIPAYNEEACIGACVASIQKELEHTTDPSSGRGVDAEIVVVNNASTDQTKEIAQGFAGVRVVDEMHKGLVRARKAGFDATTGDLVANIDADTVVPHGWLAKVMAEFDGDPSLVALSGPFVYLELSLFKRILVRIFYFFGWLIHLVNHHLLHKGAMLQGGNFIIRRDPWERAGGFDTSIEFYGEDTDVARRLSAQGTVKWTWSLPMYASSRRLQEEGILRAAYTYMINFFSISIQGHPLTDEYQDIRPN